jgi:prepilin-type N-terminal cleavage/methylation domain-containing protein
MRIKRQPGFTLMEMMIALTMIAILLVSVATAIHASFYSFSENEKISAMTQTARTVLMRMCRDIRNADSVDATTTSVTILPPAEDNVTSIVYSFEDGTLYYKKTPTGGTMTSYVLLASTEALHVQSFSVSTVMGLDSQGVNCIKSISVALCLAQGNERFTVTASADPRRNQLY